MGSICCRQLIFHGVAGPDSGRSTAQARPVMRRRLLADTAARAGAHAGRGWVTPSVKQCDGRMSPTIFNDHRHSLLATHTVWGPHSAQGLDITLRNRGCSLQWFLHRDIAAQDRDLCTTKQYFLAFFFFFVNPNKCMTKTKQCYYHYY